ncbi:MAG TPA: lytic transglycosylase domain-containing protein [Blastocatellia bacterium]|nr:lytic transglycosylase domain-containing protein [Blastocatellia bacterium]
MKSSALLTVIAVAGLFAVEARAQRTPTLVVYEAPQSRTPVKQDASKPEVNAKVKGSKETAAPAEAKPAAQNPPAPLVLSDAQPGTQVLSTTGNPKYDELVIQSAARHGVDPNLVFAVMRQESGFNPRAVSHKGASGLMQLMPATARRLGVTNIFDPAQNIDAGTRYLRFLLDTFNGDVKLALAGYNAGENAVIRYGYTVPPYRETRNYVRSISAKYTAAKHRAGKPVKKSDPVAPEAMTFAGGSSSRLSNNY